jgi:hypothetical protein
MDCPPGLHALCIEIYARAASATKQGTSARDQAGPGFWEGNEAAKIELTYSTTGVSTERVVRNAPSVHNSGYRVAELFAKRIVLQLQIALLKLQIILRLTPRNGPEPKSSTRFKRCQSLKPFSMIRAGTGVAATPPCSQMD